ncbi:MAG: hypothetical protein LUD81_11290 [Clostridiales bacterium]|nr:hypothetical protein [Clostridiales bacterium]
MVNAPYIIPMCFNFIEWVRDNLFEPLIEVIVNIFLEIYIKYVNFILNLMLSLLVSFFYGVFVAVLKLVDMFQNIFSMISGTGTVYYSYTVNGTVQSGNGYLTSVLMQIPVIKSAFIKVWGISVVLCFIFVIAAILRSIVNLKGDGPSLNEIIKSTASTFVLFFAIQVIAFGTAAVSNVVITGTQKAMNYSLGNSEDTSLANYIFAVSAINAGKTGDSELDSQTFIDQMLGASGYSGDWTAVEDYASGAKSYTDYNQVTEDLLITKIDYISGFIIIIFVLKYMLGAALAFVQRIVMIIVGFITAPFFVAMVPLDGGERFRRWQQLYIGTCFSSIGIILSVNVYLLLLPAFVSNGFVDTSVDILDYFIKAYSVVILSMGFERCTDVVNRIIDDSMLISPHMAIQGTMNAFMGIIPHGGGGAGGGGGGSSGGGKTQAAAKAVSKLVK